MTIDDLNGAFLPLRGIQVLDFGRYIAGPYCAALLADLGADVLRIEKTTGGEDRSILPFGETGDGPMYMQVNRNKRAMTLDVSSQTGRTIAHRLIERADVVIANLPPRALAQLGLDWETVHSINPRAVLVVATAFGLSGERRNNVGFDTSGQAMSGSVFMTGQPGKPYRTPVQYVDIATATSCAYGVLAALIGREKTGKGQLVEGMLLRSGLINSNPLLIEQALSGVDRQATENLGFTGAPIDLYETLTGWIVVQVLGQPIWKRWCIMTENEAMLDDTRYVDDAARGLHGSEISRAMTAWCADKTREDVLDLCAKNRIPAAPVYSPQQALDDQDFTDSGHLAWTNVPGQHTKVPIAGAPIRFGGVETEFRLPPPKLGQDTDSVLCELGYTAEGIATLRKDGVI